MWHIAWLRMLNIRSKKTAHEFSKMDSQDMFVVENVDNTSPEQKKSMMLSFWEKKKSAAKFFWQFKRCRRCKMRTS